MDIEPPGGEIPLPDESQDFVVSSHIIEHLPDPRPVRIEAVQDRDDKVGNEFAVVLRK